MSKYMESAPACTRRVIVIEADSRLQSDPRAWFEAEARQSSLGEKAWFLAHTTDGVIWGRFQDGALLLSSDASLSADGEAAPNIKLPALDAKNLQDAYLFGERAEVRVWRDGKDFKAAHTEDAGFDPQTMLDERCLLWGDYVVPMDVGQGFSLLEHGRQGLRHAVPVALTPKMKLETPLRLVVRRYFVYEKNHGQARLAVARLVRLEN